MNIGIIGMGKIGSEVARQAGALGWRLVYAASSHRAFVDNMCVSDSQGVLFESSAFERAITQCDVVFLCIPSNQPDASLDYIQRVGCLGVPLVLAEKAALADRWDMVMEYRRRLNFDATVGGGSRLLPFVREHMSDGGPDFSDLHAVLNGTLNFVFCCVDELHCSLEQAVENAKIADLTEPSLNLDTLGIMNRELGDVAQKTAIIVNLLRLHGTPTTSSAIGAVMKPLTYEMLAARDAGSRLVFSVAKKPVSFGGHLFEHRFGEYFVAFGFRNMSLAPFHRIKTALSDNAMVVRYDGGATYAISGPGAGPRETVRLMIRAALKLAVCK
ncbi:MAG: NAD(P)-binding domain-containing protein [Candidatus Vogelbacteria bacterium]|nr:NAD(P)-binding domain-containing protein [Candidatus Vogelbacteria bacterium]